MSSRPRIHLLDAHFLIFRAYHGMPDLRAPDGSPVGALRGYVATLVKFLRRQQPTHLAAAFDFALRSFRNDLYPDYKLGRTEAPEDLQPQFELCERATRALGIPLFQLESFEADDVIATLCRELLKEGADLSIATRDKDLGALVSERVQLFDPATESVSGVAEIEAKLGVPPQLVGDLLALVGDPVDNVPGVQGIGAKTACVLLRHFGDIDSIPLQFSAWQGLELRGARRAFDCYERGQERLELSRRLVRMREDLPLTVSIAELEYRGARRAECEALLGPLGFRSVFDRIPRWQD